MLKMDALEIANILATELWCHQLASFEGLNSGVPTRTTATITPTQLRSYDQTFIELDNCHSEQANHARFVPPSVTQANHYGILSQVGYGETRGPGLLHVSPGPLSSGDSSSSPGLPQPKRRNMGGRRPTKTPHDVSPEEEERRKVRRERNKQAAARCRKRRLDQTNELEEETDKLEAKRRNLQDDIRKLHEEKEHLQAVIQNHLVSCPLIAKRPLTPPEVKPFQDLYPHQYTDDGVRVKEEVMDPPVETIVVDPNVLAIDNDIFTTPVDKRVMFSATNPAVVTTASGTLDTPPVRPNRPSFLQVPVTISPAQVHTNKAYGGKIAGVEITTPSNGIPFNFESLMEGGTGLTPVHPHPFIQQTRAQPDLVSPDSLLSLVTL